MKMAMLQILMTLPLLPPSIGFSINANRGESQWWKEEVKTRFLCYRVAIPGGYM